MCIRDRYQRRVHGCLEDIKKYKLDASSSSLKLRVRIFLYNEVFHLITVKRIQGDVMTFFDLYKKLSKFIEDSLSVSYTHLRAHETSLHLVCRLLLEKKKKTKQYKQQKVPQTRLHTQTKQPDKAGRRRK
eukprot:TRINITY_DN35157_c0_g1_i1.p3 TRINITY_DN35157_c0_g1~~TRINITY_DN35157_c0_g1_i1.p3  ORF type:complete len:130 (-),score=38.67 TRINITY_DN35157_c0_g1_i1:24-413(-)